MMPKPLQLLPLALLLISTFGFNGVIPDAEAGNRSAIQRLKVQRMAEQSPQLYVPNGFFRHKENTVTLKGNGKAQTIAIYYRFLPTDESASESLERILVELTPETRVKEVNIPLPETERYQAEAKPNGLFERMKENAAEPDAGPESEQGNEAGEGEAGESYRHNSIQLQAVVLDERGQIVEKLETIGSSGQAVAHDVLPLLKPHQPSQAVVLPAIPGVDANALRGIQTMAELAADEEKRKRLQYDGSVNRDRALDKNTFTDYGPSGAAPGSR